MVMTAGYLQSNLECLNVPSGVYIVKVNTGTNTSIQGDVNEIILSKYGYDKKAILLSFFILLL